MSRWSVFNTNGSKSTARTARTNKKGLIKLRKKNSVQMNVNADNLTITAERN